MKSKLIILPLALALVFGSVPSASADVDDGAAMVADLVIARPVCLVATVVGSTFFVLGLPFALMSRSTGRAAEALVAAPARATFTRPLGDLDSLQEY